MPFPRSVGEFLAKIRVGNLDQRLRALPQRHPTQIPGAIFGNEPVRFSTSDTIASIGMDPSIFISTPGTHVTRMLSASRVSDHGVDGTGRDACCVSQYKSGFSPLNRHDTASTSSGNVGRPRMRQV